MSLFTVTTTNSIRSEHTLQFSDLYQVHVYLCLYLATVICACYVYCDVCPYFVRGTLP